MSRHTPGPWVAERHGGITALVDGQRRQVAAAVGAAVMHGDTTTDVMALQAANAALLAAAPELLEALRFFVEREVAGFMAPCADDCECYVCRYRRLIARLS